LSPAVERVGGESVRLATPPLDLIVQRWSVAGLIDKPDGSKDSRMKEEALGAVFFLLGCVCELLVIDNK